jgi:hypothetical protein
MHASLELLKQFSDAENRETCSPFRETSGARASVATSCRKYSSSCRSPLNAHSPPAAESRTPKVTVSSTPAIFILVGAKSIVSPWR